MDSQGLKNLGPQSAGPALQLKQQRHQPHFWYWPNWAS